jgi:hypothetical protein
MGKSRIVKAQTVLYRQHDRNVVGTGAHLDALEVKQPSRSLWEKIRRPRIAAAHVVRWELSQRHARYQLRAFLRCQTSKSRFIRVATLISHGFHLVGLKPNLALMIHLWRMNVDKQAD